VPNLYHAYQIAFMRDRLGVYKTANPERIHIILGAMDSKLLIPEWESERHPDIAIYLSRPKGRKDRTIWRRWIPEVVIEIVSPRSGDRDYVEKRGEYWTLGVKEYWIIDARRGRLMVLRRGRNQWIEKLLNRDDVLESKLLPEFRLPCNDIFDAAGEAEDD
jgi:Uma2 family endonuclease